ERDDGGEADPGAFDLPVARLAAQVRGDFVRVGDAGRADRVALGQQASGDVDRDLALAPRGSGVDEVTGPARLAQPQVVVVDQLRGGEAVVQLHQIEVVRPQSRFLVGRIGGVAGERVDVGLGLAAFAPRV